MIGSGSSGPGGGWARRSAGRWPRPTTSSWWPRSTRPRPAATSARWPGAAAPALAVGGDLEAPGRRRARRWRSTSPWPTRPGGPCRGAPTTDPRRGGHDRARRRTTSAWPAAFDGSRGQRRGGRQLRHRGGAADALLRAGRPVHGRRRGRSSSTTTHKRDAPSGTAMHTAERDRRGPRGRRAGPAAARPHHRDGAARAPGAARARRRPGALGAAARAGGPRGGGLRRRSARA